MKKLLTSTKALYNMVRATKDEFFRRAAENRKILIQGSCLDPKNHPSYRN